MPDRHKTSRRLEPGREKGSWVGPARGDGKYNEPVHCFGTPHLVNGDAAAALKGTGFVFRRFAPLNGRATVFRSPWELAAGHEDFAVLDRPTAAIAANRFGLGARPGELTQIGSQPRDWLRAQLAGAPPLLTGGELRSSAETLARGLELRREL